MSLGHKPTGEELERWHETHRIEKAADGAEFCENCGSNFSDNDVCHSKVRSD